MKIWVILIITFMILAGGYWLNTLSNPNENSLIDNSQENFPKVESVDNYGGLYKPEKNFEGSKYCIFVFDEQYAEYIVNKTAYKNFCNLSERFPQIQEFLYNEYKIDMEKNEEWQFPAWYVGDARITLNYKYKSAKNLDLYLAHEIAHSSTESLNLPSWFNEGIAQYSAYKFFGTQFKLTPFWFEGFEYWNPDTASYAENIAGYQHAGYVVKRLVENYGEDVFKKILVNLNGKISYEEDIDTKNKLVIEAIRLATNNQSINLREVIHP